MTDAGDQLERAPADQAQNLATALEGAAAYWNAAEGDRLARPFHVVFQVRPGHDKTATARWQQAGLKLGRLA